MSSKAGVSRSAREIAFNIVQRVHQTGSYAHILLNRELKRSKLERRDKALLTELVYGSLRAEGTLDWVLSQFTTKPIEELPPSIRDILRLAIYQLLYMNKIPVHAACNESVKLSKKISGKTFAGLVNALCRRVAKEKDQLLWPKWEEDPIGFIVLTTYHPRWIVEMWVDELGLEATNQLCQANNRRFPLALRANTLKTTVTELRSRLEQRGMETTPSTLIPEALLANRIGDISELPEFQNGLFQIQDESSMLASYVVDPQSGESVLDLCAAPGGKTTHLAALMKNKGRIIAVDLHAHRLKLIEENCRRLGVEIVQLKKGNATRLKDYMDETVDRILIDAPCSGLGTLGRRPDSRWRKTPQTIKQLVTLQQRLLESASGFLKPGGILVYATCTISRQENQDVANNFIMKHKDFTWDEAVKYTHGNIFSGDEPWIQLFPHVHKTQGFFIARFRRKMVS